MYSGQLITGFEIIVKENNRIEGESCKRRIWEIKLKKRSKQTNNKYRKYGMKNYRVKRFEIEETEFY